MGSILLWAKVELYAHTHFEKYLDERIYCTESKDNFWLCIILIGQ